MREGRNQRQQPSLHPWRLACTKAARSVHRGGTHQRMQARSAHRRMQAGLLGACIAGFCPGGARKRLMQGTAQQSNSDTTQRGPTCQVERTTQFSMAPLVRVNGQAFDLTGTSVVPSYEGFWQGSGEN